MKTLIYWILAVLLSPVSVQAQTELENGNIPMTTSTVHVLGERTEDAINLRWVPSDARLWIICNQYGYTVSRLKLDEQAKNIDGEFKTLKAVTPTSQEDWEAYLIANDLPDYPSVGMECIYGDYASLGLGKSPETIFAQADELSNKFSFALFAADMDQKTAEMSGLYYTDKDIEKEAVYVYKVTPNVPTDQMLNYSNGAVLMSTELTEYAPIMIRGKESDGSIELQWDRTSYEKMYTAYIIERSADNRTFKPIDDKPYVHGVSGDKKLVSPYISYIYKVDNYNPLYYRVVGLTPFGTRGPASPSIRASAKDLTPPESPVQVEANFVQGSTIALTWEYEEKEKIAGFNVYRGHAYEDNYYKINEQILPSHKRAFEDNSALVYDQNYYYVEAVDIAGNAARSYNAFGAIKDSIPPSIPTDLSATVDTNGIVSLQWKAVIEPDILGYKVFYANADHHEFSLLTGQALSSNVYQDSITLKSLTRHVYYKVMAVDRSYNYSPLSEILKVERPDIIPPTSPIFTNYEVKEDQIYLEWAPSHSNDIARHELWKKEGDNDWQLLKAMTQNRHQFADKKIEAGKIYQYKIIAKDQSGLESEVAYVLHLEALDNLLKDQIGNIKIQLNKDNQPVLQWHYANNENHDIVIYRSSKGTGFQILKIIDKAEATYTDKTVTKGVNYKYTLKARFAKGGQSKFSDVQEILVKL